MADKNTAVQSLAQKGCSYCRCFKPVDQVRTVRTRLGVPRAICDTCQKARRDSKADMGNTK
jgi:hypothetical protein